MLLFLFRLSYYYYFFCCRVDYAISLKKRNECIISYYGVSPLCETYMRKLTKKAADISLSISCFPFHLLLLLLIYQFSYACLHIRQLYNNIFHSSESFFFFFTHTSYTAPRAARRATVLVYNFIPFSTSSFSTLFFVSLAACFLYSTALYMSVFTIIFFNSFSNLLWSGLHGLFSFCFDITGAFLALKK